MSYCFSEYKAENGTFRIKYKIFYVFIWLKKLNKTYGTFFNVAIAAIAASTLQNSSSRNTNIQQKTYEMTVPNDLIGCIIGKGGNKIAEIRLLFIF